MSWTISISSSVGGIVKYCCWRPDTSIVLKAHDSSSVRSAVHGLGSAELCYMRQCRLRLGEPEGHPHRAIQLDGGRELAAGLLLLAERAVQHPQAVVAVRLERA